MKLNIGSMVYDLCTANEIPMPDEDGNALLCGCFLPFEEKIYVKKDLPPQVLKQTVIHEITHAFLDEIGCEKLTCDEGFVDALAKQIYSFFERNDLQKIYSYIGAKSDKTDTKKTAKKS